MNQPLQQETLPDALSKSREISGRWMVTAMVSMGIIATTCIYLYWHYQTIEFRRLTEVLGRRYPHSLPKVAGGKPKNLPTTLRIVMRVPFDPQSDNQKSAERVTETIELAKSNTNTEAFELIEIHLVHMPAESAGSIRVFKRIAPNFTEPPPDSQL